VKLLPKIVLSIVLPVLLGTAAVLYVLTGSWQRTLESELVESARRELVVRVATVPAALQSGRDTLRLMARAPVLREGSIAEIRRALQEWNHTTTDFEAFAFVDRDGLVYPADGPPVSVRDRPYYPMMARGEEVLAQPVISRLSGQPVLLLTVPIWDAQGQLASTLSGTIMLSRFFDRTVMNDRLRVGNFLLIDREGVLLAGGIDGENELLKRPVAQRSPNTAAVVEGVLAALAAEEVSPEVQVQVANDTLRVLHAPVPMVSWRLAFAEPESQLLAPLAKAQRMAWVVVIFAAMVALVLALLLFGMIVRPVRRLGEALHALQLGDRSVRAEERGEDELAELSASFNRMAESLGSSEARFAAMFDAAPFAVVVNRMSDGAFLEVNPAFQRAVGLGRDEIIGRTLADLGSVLDPEVQRQQQEVLLATGRLDNVETSSIDRDGNQHWTIYSSRLIELDGEQAVISMTVDITRQKQVEADLRESEASFNKLFELAPVPLAYSTDIVGYGGTCWNEAWYQNFGYSREEAEGRSGTDIGLWVDPADRGRYVEMALSSGGVTDFEVAMRRRDGSIRQCCIHGRFIVSAGRKLLMTAYLDYTEVRRAEAELREREIWLRSLFEVSPAGILVLDLNGKVTDCNRRFADMLGFAVNEIVGRQYLDLVLPEQIESARKGVGKMLVDPSMDVFSSERAYVRRDGSVLLGLLSARRLPNTEGSDGVLLVTVNDISDLRQAEAQRLESETKLQAVFNASPAAMIVSDVARNFASVAANDVWERQFMRSREEVMGLSGAEMGLWASVEDREKVLNTINRSGTISGFETWLIRGDGQRLLCRISASKVQAGDAELLVMVQEDVTELRRNETSLQKLNSELARQFDLVDAVARAQSNFIANAEATQAFESLLADLLQLADSEYGFIGEILTGEDGAPYLKTHAITNIAWNDETRRFYDEHAATGLEFRNLNTLFGAAILTGEPVIANAPATDPRRGGLPHGHPAMTAFLGLPIRVGGRLVGMAGVANRPGGYDLALVEWLHPLLVTIGQMVEARRAAVARQRAEAALRELNEELDVRVRERTEALNRTNQELSGALETLQRAQGDLVRSEKLAALGSLVAGVAHELNTPIGNSVTVASTLVENSDAFTEEMQGSLKRSVLVSYVDNSRRAAELLLANLQRAANLVSSFKQVAVDQTSEQRRHFDVAEVVREILAMLQPQLKKHPVDVITEIPPGLIIDGYPGPFGQVVANLVNNAAIHAFADVRDGATRGTIRIEASATSGRIRICISDDGVGIPSDHIDRIFDPFFTTRLGQGGSGLGLNIVYNIVTGMLGGEIRVESLPGKGTRFIVLLPEVAPADVSTH
jgi:PAS domain S-box-containing protein